MKILVAAFVAVMILLQPVYAFSVPQISFLPSKISVNSSFLAIVTHTEDESIRVSWLADVDGNIMYGQIPREGSKWVCYFSNTDKTSNCGPSPFNSVRPPAKFNVTSVGVSGTSGNGKIVSVNEIKLTPDVIVNETENLVNVVIYPSTTVDGISYKVYSGLDFSEIAGKSGSLTKQINAYVGSVRLDPGVYYIAFESAPQPAGEVVRVIMPGAAGDGTTPSALPIEAEDTNISFTTKPNQEVTYSGSKITNKGNSTLTSLSVSVPSAVSSYLTVRLPANTTLLPNGAAFYTVVIKTASAIDINTRIKVYSAGNLVGEIPIKASISVEKDSGSVVGGDILSSDTSVITGEFVVGKKLTRTFKLRNEGNTTISNIRYSAGTLSSLVSITPSSIPNIPAGGSQSITANIETLGANTYQGAITFTSDSGSESILVSVIAHKDITGDVQSEMSDLDTFVSGLTPAQQSQFATVYLDINSTLESALSNFNLGDYVTAKEKLAEASAKLEALEDLTSEPPPDGGGGFVDPALLMYAIIALVVVGLLVFIIKKARGRKGGEEEFKENEYAEEPMPAEEEEFEEEGG